MNTGPVEGVLQEVNGPFALAGLVLLVVAPLVTRLRGAANRKNRRLLVVSVAALGALALSGSLLLAYVEVTAHPQAPVAPQVGETLPIAPGSVVTQEAEAEEDGTAIAVGRDYKLGKSKQSSVPPSAEAPLPKDSANAAVHQKSNARGGTAITVGRDLTDGRE